MIQQDKEEHALKATRDNPSKTSGGRGRAEQGRGSYSRGNQQYHQQNDDQFQHRGRGQGGHDSTTQKLKSVDKTNVECYRCNRYGHYQSEYRTNLNRQSAEVSNFAEKEEEVSLLMVCYASEQTRQNMWYLDTGFSNHICGDKKAFSELDESFRNTVKFGDNYVVSVMGKGNVTLHDKDNSFHTISNVFYVPDLKTNFTQYWSTTRKRL